MTVHHSRGTYEIEFGSVQSVLQASASSTFVITDQNVSALVDTESLPTLALPPGETTKSLIWLEAACSWLAERQASRKSHLIALGGGVIGDLVGFVAATYMRGISYTQIPTTLLAQVDSSVGGKVAVDIPAGKNLVGAFYPPERVLVDTSMLSTLSTRQRRNGMAEVIKTGFIARPDLLDLHNDKLDLVVQTCIAYKVMVVENDEFETTGLRATLNYGHTIGHAIEQVTGYTEMLHGEAISVGMILEAELGERLGITPIGTAAAVESRLAQEGLPTHWPVKEAVPELLAAMKRDKKAVHGQLRMSLLTEIGQCKLVEDIPESEVVNLLKSR